MTRERKTFSERDLLPQAAKRKRVLDPVPVNHGRLADFRMKDLLSGRFYDEVCAERVTTTSCHPCPIGC